MRRYTRQAWVISLAATSLALAAPALALSADPPGEDEPLRLAGRLRHGPHTVGFRKETLRLDSQGTWAGLASDRRAAVPTTLDLYLWFPAHSSNPSQAALTLADYYLAQEPGLEDRAARRQRLLDDMTSPPGVETADLDRVLSAPLWAHVGSEPLPGPHPLVLWSHRDSIPTMQSVLNEFLASHGYVVAFAWPADNAPPLPWHGELSEKEKGTALEIQVRLLETAFAALEARSWIDGDRSAALSWSYGGESANLLQRRNSWVRLVVGVDSTIAGGGVFLSQEVWDRMNRNEFSVPYVLLRNGRPRLGGAQRPAPPLLAEVPAGAWHVRFPPLSHGNFNVPGGMIPGVLGLEEVSRWAVGGETARRGYELICRYALGFLDSALRPGGLALDPSRWFDTSDHEVEIDHYVRHRSKAADSPLGNGGTPIGIKMTQLRLERLRALEKRPPELERGHAPPDTNTYLTELLNPETRPRALSAIVSRIRRAVAIADRTPDDAGSFLRIAEADRRVQDAGSGIEVLEVTLPGRKVSEKLKLGPLTVRVWVAPDRETTELLFWLRRGGVVSESTSDEDPFSIYPAFEQLPPGSPGEQAYRYWPGLLYNAPLPESDPRAGGALVGFLQGNVIVEAGRDTYFRTPEGTEWLALGISETDREVLLAILRLLERELE